MSSVTTARALTSLLLAVPSAVSLPAQKPKRSPVHSDSIRALAATPSDPALRALHWRLVGPFRGGRVVAVAGDPVHPLIFYFGAVDGGVWKTTNGGETWRNVSDGTSDIASVGAIAVAPSDPNVVYVGAGEADWREDLTHGDGMWRSTDGGETWHHLGLDDTRHIAVVRVDPTNPDIVYVAAMGHAFGPNAARGVFRSSDGGKSWTKVLFVDDSTGAIDLALDPSNARILYAALWKNQRFPWGFAAGGGRSGLWKSTDGGDTWTDITGSHGLPPRPLGRIGVTVSPANPSRLWASVEAPDSTGGIFRSDDAGKSWERVNADQRFMIRPWYFSFVTADPTDENTVYALNLGTWRSVDGGGTFSRIRVPHGDCHVLWIDPGNPKRMIEGNDGGGTRFDYRTKQERDVSVWLNNYDGHAAADVPYRFQWTFPIVFSPHDRNTLYATAQKVFRTTDGGTHWQAISPDLTHEYHRALACRRGSRVPRGEPVPAGRLCAVPLQDRGLRQDLGEDHDGHTGRGVHTRDPRGPDPARAAVRRHRDGDLRVVRRRRALAIAAAQPAA